MAVTQRRPMDLSCPHCQARIPMPQDISVQQMTCPACGRDVALDELPTMAPVGGNHAAGTMPPSVQSAAASASGQPIIKGYEIVKVVARGGMGEIYEAIQKSLNRRVAIKVLPRELAGDTNFVRRFEREAGALAQLSHPNIGAIYDRGCDDGCYYFVLEYIAAREGGPAVTLHRRLRFGSPLKTADVKRLLEQIAGALAYAHNRGIIHRDIKPSNVLLDAHDNARLVDFGIAQLLQGHHGEDLRLTLTGEVLGTASYLAPEQREGRTDIDGRADVFACGVMSYEMLTGQLPEGAFELPSEIVPGLDPAWDAFVEKAIQRNRDRRFQRMEDFLEALRSLPVEDDGRARHSVRAVFPAAEDRRVGSDAPYNTPIQTKPDTAFQRTPILGKCGQCETLNPGDNRYCTECGASLYESCPACQAENRVGTKFCGKCGTDLVKLKRAAGYRSRIAALMEQANQIQGVAALPILTEAHDTLSKLLNEQPADADAQTTATQVREKLRWLLLEKARVERGTDALATYRRTLGLFPGDTEAQSRVNALEQELEKLTKTARELMGKEEFKAAIEHLARSLLEFGPEAGLLRLRGEAMTKLRSQFMDKAETQRGLDAMATYREMLRVLSDDTAAQSRLSALEQQLQNLKTAISTQISRGEFQLAFEAIEKALEQFGQEPDLLALRVEAQTKFAAHLDELIQRCVEKREYVAVLRNLDELGRYLPEPARFDTARQLGQEAVKKAREKTERGNQLLAQKKHRKAAAEYRAAFQACVDYTAASKGLEKAEHPFVEWLSSPASVRGPVLVIAVIPVFWVLVWLSSRLLNPSNDQNTSSQPQSNAVQNQPSTDSASAEPPANAGYHTTKVPETRAPEIQNPIRIFRGDPYFGTSVVFSPDGRYVLSGGHQTVKLWDAATGSEIRTFRGHQGTVTCVAYSPDGRYVLSGAGGAGDYSPILWEAATGNETRRFRGHSSDIQSVAFSSDGRHVLSGSWDKTAKLWEVATAEEIRTYRGHTNAVCSGAFSPDGQYVLTGSKDRTAKLWETVSGREIRTFCANDADAQWKSETRWSMAEVPVAFSSDGLHVLSGNGKTATIWEAATGRELRTFGPQEGWIDCVAFSPDGRYVATGANEVRLWETASGSNVGRFAPGGGNFAFSPDGRYVLTINGNSSSSTAELWDLGK